MRTKKLSFPHSKRERDLFWMKKLLTLERKLDNLNNKINIMLLKQSNKRS